MQAAHRLSALGNFAYWAANFSLISSYTPLASSPSRGPASQPAVTGPIEVLETSAGLPSEPVATQPPPEEPPVMVQPMRYIVGSSA